MKTTHKRMLAVAAGAFLLAVSATAIAGERGKFQGHAVLEVTKFNEFKAPEGHPYKAAISGDMDGLIFHNGGGTKLDKMLDRAHYVVQFVGDAGTGTSYCMKTFTTSEGHNLFARCDGKNNDKGATGTVTLLGGTGPFTGIKGKGKFNVVFVTDRVCWDDIEWDWETP